MLHRHLADLSPEQISILQNLLNAGFRFVTLERLERYLGVEREGFVALLEPVPGGFSTYSQAGYRLGEGLGMLVEHREGKRFVWKNQSVPATPERLAAYERFRTELSAILERR